MLELLGIVALLAALVPVCMAGGQMIAAFMLGRRILAWLSLTLACMLALVGGALATLQWGQPLMESHGAWTAPVSAALLAAPAWLAYLAGKHWIEKTS
jgi:hypothetical protein